MTNFEGVVPALAQALEKRGYSELTPVQLAVLAPELKDADALVSAQTGSGKTVAFGLNIAPTLLAGAERFERGGTPQALVVAPTRELALQVKRELEWLYAGTGASLASCVGGMDMRNERRVLERGAQIVVGTPGRLCDHIGRGSLDIKGLKAVVLDEADEMLDMGFREDLEYILKAAPDSRRTLMFSATVPRAIANLAKRYQRDAVRVSTAAEHSQHVDIEYRAMTVAPNDRENAIVNVLRYFEPKNALVFCGTRMAVNHMTSRFANRGISVVALSGELSQNERTHSLQAMRDGRAQVCIATDVAARGIDLPNLELVIHADIPKNREMLLHRSGRTGRAGRKGVCALIVPHNMRRQTERLLSNANIDAIWAKPPTADQIIANDRERILTDPTLIEDLSEDEKPFVQELLSRYSAEQIAGAFLRQQLAGQTAPEELLDVAPSEFQKKRRDDFKGGVWLSLSVGRDQNAEPRWLLPMLCRAGNITKNEIGRININQADTHVELTPACVDKFLAALGPSAKMEKTISVTRLKGAPSGAREGGRSEPRGRSSGPAGKPYQGKKPYEKKAYEKKPYEKKPYEKKPYEKKPYDKDARDKKPFEKKPYEKKTYADRPRPSRDPSVPARGFVKRPESDDGSAKPWEKRKKKSAAIDGIVQPWDKPKKKTKAKKPHKKKLAKLAAKQNVGGGGAPKGGFATPKRKNPRD